MPCGASHWLPDWLHNISCCRDARDEHPGMRRRRSSSASRGAVYQAFAEPSGELWRALVPKRSLTSLHWPSSASRTCQMGGSPHTETARARRSSSRAHGHCPRFISWQACSRAYPSSSAKARPYGLRDSEEYYSYFVWFVAWARLICLSLFLHSAALMVVSVRFHTPTVLRGRAVDPSDRHHPSDLARDVASLASHIVGPLLLHAPRLRRLGGSSTVALAATWRSC
jgi:hypothetical protein